MASVAIVGRPNVGKSSLFNRLVGRREAIVADRPGVTRDVKAAEVETDGGARFTLLDTGGLWSGDRWEAPIRRRIEAALDDVVLILFCVDGRSEPTAADYDIAAWLRARPTPVLLVATKVDDPRHEETGAYFELFGLGIGTPHPTAAEHARGTFELLARIEEHLPSSEPEVEEEAVRIAIVGRPNVGKSSLLNALVGSERVIVADVPGTTRDSVDVRFHFAGRPFVLVDTAGIRRKPSEQLEHYAKVRAEEAVRRADVAILVVDSSEIGDHELRVANLAYHAGKPVVVAVNKWDLVGDDELVAARERVRVALDHIAFAPQVFTSAVTDFGLHELLATAIRVYDTARTRVATGVLNRWIEIWTQRQAPPNFKGRPLKLLYATQADIAPPTFVFSVNSERFITRAYEQYLRNRIRDDLDFAEVPFRLIFKARGAKGGKRVRL